MAARRQFCVAIAGLLLVLGAAACGGGGTATNIQTLPLGNGDAASKLATTIKNRLIVAGYAPRPPAGLIGSANNPPIPEEAFTLSIDPTSPESFIVTVLVFHSTKDAQLFQKHDTAACEAIASCRKAQKANYGQGRQRNIGSVIYAATSVSGTSVVPASTFQKIIAVAQGESK